MFDKLLLFIYSITRITLTSLDKIKSVIEQNKGLRLLSFLLVILFFGGAIFLLNIKTPLVLDDFAYSYNRITGERVVGLYDILQSQYEHYFGWGGRVVVHSIAQFILMFDPMVADLINSLAFVFYTILIYVHIKGRSTKHDIGLFALINVLTWILQPAFGESLLWLTGSANYLFGMIITLLFLLPYRLYHNQKSKHNQSYVAGVLFFFIGIISGWTNENVAIAMIAGIILFIAYYKKEQWQIPKWAIFGLVGSIIGYILMIAAPGNYVRAQTIGLDTPVTFVSLVTQFYVISRSLILYAGIFNLIGFIILLLYLHFETDKKRKQQTIAFFVIYLIIFFVSLYSMILSPMFPARAWFGSITINLVCVGLLFYRLNNAYPVLRRIKYSILFIVCFCYFPFIYHEGYKDVNRIYNMIIERERIIEQSRNTDKTITFPYIHSETKFGISDTPFISGPLSKYYGIDIEVVDTSHSRY